MRFSRKGPHDHKGFTPIELMITWAILGILVTIVLLTMLISRNRAQQAACKSNLRNLFDALKVFELAHGTYPAAPDDLVTDGQIRSSFSWTCPSGDLGTTSGDYRNYYTQSTGEISCPRASHNP
ncbi:MAG TPA: prepilin-type N-terminal cleavage/methylation domain-containing protein [Candidatus Anoxymicrobiaceae bacterium]|jgi:prepilin-type N-terminal cleavage/methylation domain-containing protein